MKTLKDMRPVYVTGIGAHPYQYRSGASYAQLGLRAVREALVALGALLPEQISLRTADLPAQGPTILADSGQITLMLTNLVTNAVEAIGGQAGEIVLGTGVKPASVFGNSSYSPLDWEPGADRYACLSVSDTGCGMDADIHAAAEANALVAQEGIPFREAYQRVGARHRREE